MAKNMQGIIDEGSDHIKDLETETKGAGRLPNDFLERISADKNT